LRDNHVATIMPVPRRQIPILIVAPFLSSSPRYTKESNAMKKSTTPAGIVPAAIVEEAWQQVGASFERFCLTAGIAALAGMMEGDAARLCGVRYGRDDDKNGYRWGRT
jgi:hypothetical protein